MPELHEIVETDPEKFEVIKNIKDVDIYKALSDNEKIRLFQKYADYVKLIEDKKSNELKEVYSKNEEFYAEVNTLLEEFSPELLFIKIDLQLNIENNDEVYENCAQPLENLVQKVLESKMSITVKKSMFEKVEQVFERDLNHIATETALKIIENIKPGMTNDSLDMVQLFYIKCRILAMYQKYSEVIKVLKKVKRLLDSLNRPYETLAALFLLGHFYEKSDNLNESVKHLLRVLSEEDTSFEGLECDILYWSLYDTGKVKFQQGNYNEAHLALTEFSAAIDRNTEKFREMSIRMKEWRNVLGPIDDRNVHAKDMLQQISNNVASNENKKSLEVPKEFANLIKKLEADRLHIESRVGNGGPVNNTKTRLKMVDTSLKLFKTVGKVSEGKYNLLLKDKALHHLKLGQKEEAVVTFWLYYEQFEKDLEGIDPVYNEKNFRKKLKEINDHFFDYFGPLNDFCQVCYDLNMFDEIVDIIILADTRRQVNPKYEWSKYTFHITRWLGIASFYLGDYVTSWKCAYKLGQFEKDSSIMKEVKRDKLNPKLIYEDIHYVDAVRELKIAKYRRTFQMKYNQFERGVGFLQKHSKNLMNKEMKCLYLFHTAYCFYKMHVNIEAMRFAKNCQSQYAEIENGKLEILTESDRIAFSILFILSALQLKDSDGVQIPGTNYQRGAREEGIKFLEIHPHYCKLLPGLLKFHFSQEVYQYFNKKSYYWKNFHYAGPANMVRTYGGQSSNVNVIRITRNPHKRKFRFFKNSTAIIFHARDAFEHDMMLDTEEVTKMFGD